jgi:AcrR family transcriptional regulator
VTATKKSAKAKQRISPTRQAKPESKSEATRAHLLSCALTLFTKHGVDTTTMRAIATAADLSLGAAYYYFPSKESMLLSYYQESQTTLESLQLGTTGSLRERLGQLFHGKIDNVAPRKAMLSSIIGRLLNPDDQISAFSAQTMHIRQRTIDQMVRALEVTALPASTTALLANALWLAQMASLLVLVSDHSKGATRTHQLIDESLDMVVPLVPWLATPMGTAIVTRVSQALTRAGIEGI